jgi:hypothetical protein
MAYTVADSVTLQNVPKALTFDQILDKISELQAEKAKLEKEIKELKVPAKTEMKARLIGSYTTPNGTGASLYDTNRTNADRKAAEQVCTPEQIAAIFKVTTTENFKVK